jgi:starch phosphorylase
MKRLGAFFNTHRMITEYFEKYYRPSFEKRFVLFDKSWKNAIDIAAWKEKVKQDWSKIKVVNFNTNGKAKPIFVGEEFPVSADISLGDLTPDDVEVQIYFGPIEKQDNPQFNSTVVMSHQS